MKKSKNKLIIEIVIIFLLLIVIGLAILTLFRKEIYTSSDMDDSLREMSLRYYDSYYDEISNGKTEEEIKQYLEKYKDTGIKLSLNDLSDYDPSNNDPIIEKFVKDEKECDREGTKAIIYPKSPYGKNDIDIESIIDCN